MSKWKSFKYKNISLFAMSLLFAFIAGIGAVIIASPLPDEVGP